MDETNPIDTMKEKFRLMMVLAVVMMTVAAQAQKFAILSDIHVTPGNANETQLRKAVAEINACDADAVLLTGDLTNEGSDEQLRNVKGIMDGVTKPLWISYRKLYNSIQ